MMRMANLESATRVYLRLRSPAPVVANDAQPAMLGDLPVVRPAIPL